MNAIEQHPFDTSFSQQDTSIFKLYGHGLKVVARLKRDDYMTPEPDIYGEDDVASFNRGEWTFWDMDIEVWIDHNRIAWRSFRGGIDCADEQYRNDAYLDSLAAEGLREVDVLGIVRDYAIKVASAALAVASAR